jgi:transposase InsO family protein
VAYFKSLRVVVRRVLTDNGGVFRSRDFATACQQLGVKHTFTRAYRRQTNGKAERFIQSAMPRVGLWLQLSDFLATLRSSGPLDPPLQLAPPTPGHRRTRTQLQTHRIKKQPLDASHLVEVRSAGPQREGP